MQASIFTEVLLPLALAFVMFGMGLTLTIKDFARLIRAPRSILAGFIGQIVLLPLLAFLLCLAFELPAYLSIGVMVLAACPGGTTSNLISHIARANLALSVSLTAVSTLVCVFTTPLIIQFAIHHFASDNPPVFSISETVVGLIGISIMPVCIGMLIRATNQKFAIKTEHFFRQFSMYFMLAMIVGVLVSERDSLLSSFKAAFLVCLTLNFLSVLLGLALAKLTALSLKDAVTLSIEVGVQNAALAMLVCITFLQSPEYAIAPGVYGIAMYVGPLLLAMWAKKHVNASQLSQ